MDRLSVVVLTFNRKDEVLACLADMLKNDSDGYPVIVVDNGSTDGTADAITRHYPEVELVRAPHNLGAAGRNLGVDRVKTPLVAFSDDDTRWEAGALRRAESLFFDHARLGVLSARVVVGETRRPDPSCDAMLASPLPGIQGIGPGLIGFMAGACVMRTDVFRGAGGYWAPLFIGGEETLLALDILRQGWHIVYAAELVSCHYPSVHRNARQRRDLLARNAIWTAWMRWPVALAWRITCQEFSGKKGGAEKLRLFSDVLKGVPQVLSRRRASPQAVCRAKQLVDMSESRQRSAG